MGKSVTLTRDEQPGFTMVELLIVVAVLVVVAGVVLPSLASSRERGRESVCINHLRQIGQAFQMYLDDYHQRPPRLDHLTPAYIRDRRIFVCPNDAWVGRGGWAWAAWGRYTTPPEKWPFPVSYGYFFGSDTVFDRRWKKAQEVPGEPGYVVCVLHGSRRDDGRPYGVPYFHGRTLRLCFDGRVIATTIHYRPGQKFDAWKLLTGQAFREARKSGW